MVPILLRLVKQATEGVFRLHRLNIGPRLTVCFLLIIVAMLVGDGVLLWQFQQARGEAERLAGVDQVLIAVLRAHTGLMSFYDKLEVVAQSEDTVQLAKQIETLHDALLEDTQLTRNALSQLPTEVQLDPALEPTLLAIQGELPAQLEAIANLAKSGAWNAVRLRLTNQVRPLKSRSAALVEDVNREVAAQQAQALLNIRQAQQRIFLIVPMTAAITLVFAALLGSMITRSITQPLGGLVEGATALATGDFSHQVPRTGNDEIARLSAVFNNMVAKLREVYRDLRSSESYLAEAQRLSRTGSFGWDISTGKIYWSAETFRIFEFDPTKRVTVNAILERTHPEDRATLEAVIEHASRDLAPAFVRFADSQIGHGQPALIPRVSTEIDYEGELAVVIGRAGRYVPQEQALQYVAGYSCYNDISVRDWQRHSTQFIPGKNFPGTGSFGPWIVTADEIPNPQTLELSTRLNGQVVQHASTAQMIFPVTELIAYCSSFTPLSPGDVIVSGTPGGVGVRRTPQVFMKPGDVVEVEISSIGTLRNQLVHEE